MEIFQGQTAYLYVSVKRHLKLKERGKVDWEKVYVNQEKRPTNAKKN
jgi:hypothetical protein